LPAPFDDENLHQAQRLQDLPPFLGLALQPLEDVLEKFLAVPTTEGVFRDFNQVRVVGEVQLVRGYLVKLILEPRLGQFVLTNEPTPLRFFL
jgi:hypothetical protein